MSSNPLAEAIRGVPGEAQPIAWRSGVLVTAVDTTATPHTVTVRLADGTYLTGVPYLGWWQATVDERVELVLIGQAPLVLGPVAPATLATYTPPTPPTPPAPPPPPPTIRTVQIQPTSADPGATWDSGGYWSDYIRQGGTGSKRGHYFYGTQIQDAIGSGTLLSGTIYIERVNDAHGVSGEANVRLGTHTYTARPGSGSSALAAVSVVGTLRRGKGKALKLSTAQVAQLNAGADGLGLEPGATSYSSPDYLKATREAPGGALALTIQD